MPTAHDSLGVVGMDHGKVYVIGGRDSQWYLGTNEAYDPATHTWIARASCPPSATRWGVDTLNGKIYVAGGASGQRGSILTTLEE